MTRGGVYSSKYIQQLFVYLSQECSPECRVILTANRYEENAGGQSLVVTVAHCVGRPGNRWLTNAIFNLTRHTLSVGGETEVSTLKGNFYTTLAHQSNRYEWEHEAHGVPWRLKMLASGEPSSRLMQRLTEWMKELKTLGWLEEASWNLADSSCRELKMSEVYHVGQLVSNGRPEHAK